MAAGFAWVSVQPTWCQRVTDDELPLRTLRIAGPDHEIVLSRTGAARDKRSLLVFMVRPSLTDWKRAECVSVLGSP
jgi:hypothetical protein